MKTNSVSSEEDIRGFRIHEPGVAPGRSAGFQPAVSPISNRQAVRPFLRAQTFGPLAGGKPCDTAERGEATTKYYQAGFQPATQSWRHDNPGLPPWAGRHQAFGL